MTGLTSSQKDALKWLSEHNSDGGFDKHNVLIAGGEKAPFMRSTWNTLAEADLVEFYGGATAKRRVKLTQAGRTIADAHTYRNGPPGRPEF